MLSFRRLIYLASEVCPTLRVWRDQDIEANHVVGPSSSHTVGPMRAARIFITDLKELSLLEKVSPFQCLYSESHIERSYWVKGGYCQDKFVSHLS